MRPPRSALALALALGLGLPAAVAAATVLRPSPSGRSSYGESFTFIADLEDGSYVHLTLSLTNLGPGGLKGICRGTVVAPSGSIWKASTRVGRSEVAFTSGPERLAVGRCAASLGTGAGAGLTAEVRLDEGQVTLAFAGPPLPRPPHDAVAVVGSDLYRSEVLYQQARVEATLAPAGQPARTLSGQGYADHSRSTVAGKELARRWVRFRGLRGGGLLVLGREGLDGRFGPLWSCAAGGDGRCREYLSFRVERGGSAEAPTFAVALQGEASSLALRSTQVLLRDAPVEELGLLGKLVAPFVGSPVTFTCRARARSGDGSEAEGILEVEEDGE